MKKWSILSLNKGEKIPKAWGGDNSTDKQNSLLCVYEREVVKKRTDGQQSHNKSESSLHLMGASTHCIWCRQTLVLSS